MKIFLLVLILSLSLSFSVLAEVVETVVAIVNGSIITKSDIAKQKERLKTGTIVDDLFGHSPQDLLKDEKLLLRQMIDEKVVDAEVKKQNLGVNMERVEQEINSIQGRNNISREQLKDALKKEGTSLSEYQDFIKHRLERQGVIEKAITSKIKISDDDLAAAYENKNKNSSSKSFEYKISHILLRQGKRSDAEQERRANEIAAKLKSGSSFEELASQYSEDPNYNEGGLLGSFKRGEIFKPLDDALKNLNIGEWVGPIKTKIGYQLVKLLDKKSVTDSAFESKKDALRAELYQKAFIKQFQFWLEQKRADSFIRIN